MKKVLLFILPIILLMVSCQKNDYTIQQTVVDPGNWVVVTDTTGTHTVQTKDTSYIVGPSTSEKIHFAKVHGDIIWVVVGLILMIVCLGLFIYKTSTGDTRVGWFLLIALAIFGGGGLIGGSVDWTSQNMEQQIPKRTYDSLMQKDGNLHSFWSTIPVK